MFFSLAGRVKNKAKEKKKELSRLRRYKHDNAPLSNHVDLQTASPTIRGALCPPGQGILFFFPSLQKSCVQFLQSARPTRCQHHYSYDTSILSLNLCLLIHQTVSPNSLSSQQETITLLSTFFFLLLPQPPDTPTRILYEYNKTPRGGASFAISAIEEANS